LSFLTNHPIGEKPWRVPARPSIAETNGYWDNVAEGTQAALRFALGHAWYGYASETLQVVDEALVRTLKGETDLATALELTGEVALAQPTLPSSSASIVIATPKPTAAPESAVTVDYYVNTFAHTTSSGIEALAEEFNRTHPGIEVRPSTELVGAGSGSFTLFDVAEQFDCFAWPGTIHPAAIEQLYSLDPLLETTDISLADDFTPALMDAFRIDDELYALPIATMPTVIYYNADHLAKLGLEPPPQNWTADDFFALAAAATSGEGKDKVYGFVPFQGDAIGFLLAVQDVRLYDLHAEQPAVHFDHPEVVNAVAWIVSLADAGIMPSYDDGGTHSLTGNHDQREKLIVSGHAALWTDLAELRGGFTVDEEANFQIGVAPLPLIPGSLLEPPFTNSLYISRRATDPIACWLWLMFLSEHPEVFRGVPVRNSVAESEAWEAAIGIDKARAYRAGLSRLALDRSFGDKDKYSLAPIDIWWQDALAASFQGEDVVVALTEAQQKSDAYLTCLTPEGNEEQSRACAEKADPGFRTFEELLKEQLP
jgi:ABC-type glycerol-3-phosphate transport system substrate-binding protein